MDKNDYDDIFKMWESYMEIYPITPRRGAFDRQNKSSAPSEKIQRGKDWELDVMEEAQLIVHGSKWLINKKSEG